MATKDDTRPLENLAQLMGAVDDQRCRLLNVLGTLQCARTAADQGCSDEVSGALALLEEEIQRIVTGLEESPLLKVAAAREEAAAAGARP